MTMRAIDPEGATIPSISQGMLIEGGRLLVLSGHVPLDEGGNVVGEDHAAQPDRVFANLQATLRAAGGEFRSVVQLTIYVRDYRPDLLDAIRTVRNRWIDADRPPASALIGVAALFDPRVLVDVDGLAVIDG